LSKKTFYLFKIINSFWMKADKQHDWQKNKKAASEMPVAALNMEQ
jgi:hypothetical protein